MCKTDGTVDFSRLIEPSKCYENRILDTKITLIRKPLKKTNTTIVFLSIFSLL